jgi:predicted RecB family nuclease
MYVVSPSKFALPEEYLVGEYAAYYRLVKAQLEQAVESIPDFDATVAEPTSHCEVCRWWKKCDSEWRASDHLSLVAGISRLQRKQLTDWNIVTVAQLGSLALPITRKPDYGSGESYVRVREQARLQVTGRKENRLVHELFDIRGLCQLPEPSPGDIFFDLEGDAFAGDGMEYLFGFVQVGAGGKLAYQSRWCFNADEEKAAFQWFIDQVMQSKERYFDLHVYHFTAHQPATLKRLMGRYATREDEVDRILRGERMVDLHRVLKQSVRASVEEYSLKTLERFYGFQRSVPLDDARPARRLIEHCLELGRLEEISPEARETV